MDDGGTDSALVDRQNFSHRLLPVRPTFWVKISREWVHCRGVGVTCKVLPGGLAGQKTYQDT